MLKYKKIRKGQAGTIIPKDTTINTPWLLPNKDINPSWGGRIPKQNNAISPVSLPSPNFKQEIPSIPLPQPNIRKWNEETGNWEERIDSIQNSKPNITIGEQPSRGAIFKRDMYNMLQGDLAPWNFSEANRIKDKVSKVGRLLYKKGGKVQNFQTGGLVEATSPGIRKTKYAPINRNPYTAVGGAVDLNFGHEDKDNPAVFYRQGENYKNAFGPNASMPGMVNTPSGSLRRGEVEAWRTANDATTAAFEFNDKDQITNKEAARTGAFKDFRSQYGATSVMDDPQFAQTYAQGAERMFEDPTLNQIDYGQSIYTKPEGYASTPGQEDYFKGSLDKYGVNAYQYARQELPPELPQPIPETIEPTPEVIEPALKPTKTPVQRSSFGPGKKVKKGTSTRYLDKMRRKKREKGGLLY